MLLFAFLVATHRLIPFAPPVVKARADVLYPSPTMLSIWQWSSLNLSNNVPFWSSCFLSCSATLVTTPWQHFVTSGYIRLVLDRDSDYLSSSAHLLFFAFQKISYGEDQGRVRAKTTQSITQIKNKNSDTYLKPKRCLLPKVKIKFAASSSTERRGFVRGGRRARWRGQEAIHGVDHGRDGARVEIEVLCFVPK